MICNCQYQSILNRNAKLCWLRAGIRHSGKGVFWDPSIHIGTPQSQPLEASGEWNNRWDFSLSNTKKWISFKMLSTGGKRSKKKELKTCRSSVSLKNSPCSLWKKTKVNYIFFSWSFIKIKTHSFFFGDFRNLNNFRKEEFSLVSSVKSWNRYKTIW